MFVKPFYGLAIKEVINQAKIVMNKVILIFRFLYWGLEAAYQELMIGKTDPFKGVEAQ